MDSSMEKTLKTPKERGTGREVWHRIALAAIALIAAALALGGAPARADIWTVENIPVDASAESAIQAREMAQNQGRLKAFETVLKRITLPQDWDRLPVLSPQELLDYEVSFQVNDEQRSNRRFLAKMTYSFFGPDVEGLLQRSGIPFTTAQAKPVLLLPVWQNDDGVFLWGEEANPWLQEFLSRDFSNELVPILLPLGDLLDVSTLTPDAALEADWAAVAPLADRYDLDQVAVAVATPDGEGGLEVAAEILAEPGPEEQSGYGDPYGQDESLPYGVDSVSPVVRSDQVTGSGWGDDPSGPAAPGQVDSWSAEARPGQAQPVTPRRNSEQPGVERRDLDPWSGGEASEPGEAWDAVLPDGVETAGMALDPAQAGPIPGTREARYLSGELQVGEVIPVGAEAFDNAIQTLVADLQVGWKEQTAFSGLAQETLEAVAVFRDFEDWLELRRRLQNVSLIADAHPARIDISEAVLDLTFGGSLEQLELNLSQQDLYLGHGSLDDGEAHWRIGRGPLPEGLTSARIYAAQSAAPYGQQGLYGNRWTDSPWEAPRPASQSRPAPDYWEQTRPVTDSGLQRGTRPARAPEPEPQPDWRRPSPSPSGGE